MNLWLLALIAHGVLALIAVVSVLRGRKEPMAMLAWVLAVVEVPFVGTALYYLLGANPVQRRFRRRRRRIAHRVANFNRRAAARARSSEEAIQARLPEDLVAVERIGRRLGDMPATEGNDVHVYDDADQIYAALEEAIRSARHHVHLEYYIWQPDETGRQFRDLLVEKARQGVECRLLLDAVGCFRLRKSFTRPLLDAGVELAWFLPVRPLRRRWSPHLRNHRKIAVIDGHTAFVGSQNIGDEYRGRLKRLSPWYDSHMRIRGSAALFLQQTFAEDWTFAARRDLSEEVYFPEPPASGGSIVQVLPTGPDQGVGTLEKLLFGALESARSNIRIATPYFVPSHAVCLAIAHARQRGVHVRIVLPSRTDMRLVLWAARSFYQELLEGGVEIYEFDRGMLHSKIMTVDDRWCMLGSANMDVRSFRLNFEVTALVYDQQVATTLARSVDERCRHARRITLRDAAARTIRQQLIEGMARLFAPLL